MYVLITIYYIVVISSRCLGLQRKHRYTGFLFLLSNAFLHISVLPDGGLCRLNYVVEITTAE
jgi:allantoicase